MSVPTYMDGREITEGYATDDGLFFVFKPHKQWRAMHISTGCFALPSKYATTRRADILRLLDRAKELLDYDVSSDEEFFEKNGEKRGREALMQLSQLHREITGAS